MLKIVNFHYRFCSTEVCVGVPRNKMKLFLDSLTCTAPRCVEHEKHWFLLFNKFLDLFFVFNVLYSVSLWIFKPGTIGFWKPDKIFKLLKLVFGAFSCTYMGIICQYHKNYGQKWLKPDFGVSSR